MIYLDTSCVVKCYLHEPGTEQVLAWLEGKTGLTCCLYGRLEFMAAVQRHVREQRLSPVDARAVCRRLELDDRAGLWRWISLTEALIRSACQRLEALPPALFLRAGDALHLTCALEHGFDVVYSHDQHLLRAAPAFGLQGVDILAP
jgi:predicted nucleic acid-binding protein